MSRGPRDDRLAVTVVLEDPGLPYPYQASGVFNALDRSDQRRLREALSQLTEHRFELLDRHDTLAAELAARRPGLVFNLCDTGFRNRGELEAHIPALLEMLEIPYSGAAPAGLLLCRDKAMVRAVAAGLGVPVPRERYLGCRGAEGIDDFPYPAIVKPNLEEGSRGLSPASVVDGPAAAAARIRALHRELPGSPLLMQEFLGGAEYSVGLIGNPETGFVQLPISEVDYSALPSSLPPILAFDFKTRPDSAYASRVRYRRAAAAPAMEASLGAHSRRLFARLGCRDYARIDFRADEAGTIKLLEVNPNPAWVWHGGLHTMAAAAGHDYPGFLRLLLRAALTRIGLVSAGEPGRRGAVSSPQCANGGPKAENGSSGTAS